MINQEVFLYFLKKHVMILTWQEIFYKHFFFSLFYIYCSFLQIKKLKFELNLFFLKQFHAVKNEGICFIEKKTTSSSFSPPFFNDIT